MLDFTPVPLFQRPLREFTAPNPWTGGPPVRWQLGLYRMVIASAAPLEAKRLAARRAAGRDGPDPAGDPLPGRRMPGKDEAIGFALAEGGPPFVLPSALQSAWWEGEVPDARLPGLFAALSPRLGAWDYVVRRRATGLRIGIIALMVIGLAIAAAAFALLPPRAHVQLNIPARTFLDQPAAEGFFTLYSGALRVQLIGPVDGSRLVVPPGLELRQPIDSIGWYAAAGGRRLILYATKAAGVTLPSQLAIGVVLRAERLGFDAREAAASAGADPALVFVHYALWQDSADPTGLAHNPALLLGLIGVFPAGAVAMLVMLGLLKWRERRLRARVRDLLLQQ